jgi:glycosyltransferase involved in cell wall biosynthesis
VITKKKKLNQENEKPPVTKVAMVVRSFSTSGGLELYAHKLVEGLLDRNFRITVICEQSDSTFVHPNLEVLRFEKAPGHMTKAGKIDHYRKSVAQVLSEHGPFDLVHSQHLGIDNADIVTFHNHTVHRLSQAGIWWERYLNLAKAQLIPAYQKRNEMDNLLAKNAHALIFPSAVCKDDFGKAYALNGKEPLQVVAYPGSTFDTGTSSESQPAHNGKNQTTPFTFLFVGRGFRKKGLDVLLKACRILKQRKLSFQLHIAGMSAKPIDRLRLQLNGLADVVTYLGFRKDMPNVYSQCQAIVLPSRLEPFGMAPVQAMLYGLVPIVSRVCGVAEVLTNEKNALIVENQLSAQELADAMQRLLGDDALKQSLLKEGRHVRELVDWKQTVVVTENAYGAAISKKQALGEKHG